MAYERDFKGIWIPKEIWLTEDLTMQEKLFYVEINSLDNESGCFAGNNHFAEFFGISKQRVSLVIKSLIEKGFVKSTIIYKKNSKQIDKRVLNICMVPSPIKVGYPPLQKFKGNNTTNNTNNTIPRNTISEEEEHFFNQIWKEYSLVFMKEQGRAGGSKKKAKEGYKKLLGKYKREEIVALIKEEKSKLFGVRDLERVLRLDVMKQFKEDGPVSAGIKTKGMAKW